MLQCLWFGEAEIEGCNKSLGHRRKRGRTHSVRDGGQQYVCAAERDVSRGYANIDRPRRDDIDESIAQARRFRGILNYQHAGACAPLPLPPVEAEDVPARADRASVSSCTRSGDPSINARNLRRRAVSALAGSPR